MLYVDSSAMAKLVIDEDETRALRAFFEASAEPLATSAVSRVEAGPAAAFRGAEAARQADIVLERFFIIVLSDQVVREAVTLKPSALRTLDAIHVASALVPGLECAGLVTYDLRMQAAARLAGLHVVAPA